MLLPLCDPISRQKHHKLTVRTGTLRVNPEVSAFGVWFPDRHVACIIKVAPIICFADPLSCAGAAYVGLEGPVAICPQRPFLIFLSPVTWQASWRPFMWMVIHALIQLISPPVMICTVSYCQSCFMTHLLQQQSIACMQCYRCHASRHRQCCHCCCDKQSHLGFVI